MGKGVEEVPAAEEEPTELDTAHRFDDKDDEEGPLPPLYTFRSQ